MRTIVNESWQLIQRKLVESNTINVQKLYKPTVFPILDLNFTTVKAYKQANSSKQPYFQQQLLKQLS